MCCCDVCRAGIWIPTCSFEMFVAWLVLAYMHSIGR